eukprot:TRINITY_DN3718_c0_g1_i2.p1 TRINITY_DN3718_c0_g1~~TRINITY_DN3718_c0_g1_i2.p1  ORF type:complete len:130 (-),score=13.25 TRINITY_DN3718_c0_g1_i2:333-722(-)
MIPMVFSPNLGPTGSCSTFQVSRLPYPANNITASVDELSEGLPRSLMTNGLRQGVNSFRQANVGYYGPAPPSHYPNSRVVRGTHWYTFTLYALDAVPRVGFAPGRVDLLNAMRGHVLAQTTLVGYYDVL